jgi:hypothetical protein
MVEVPLPKALRGHPTFWPHNELDSPGAIRGDGHKRTGTYEKPPTSTFKFRGVQQPYESKI